jgi:heme oxygenase
MFAGPHKTLADAQSPLDNPARRRYASIFSQESLLVTLRERLKAETAGRHQQLEAALDWLQLRQRSDYVLLLERFFGFYEPVEQQLTSAPAELVDLLEPRRKVPRLAADLAYFGRSADDLARLPRCADVPNIAAPAQALGGYYVFEGSTLGGVVLCKHFAQTLQLESEGLAFFHGYGDQTGPMWRAFCQRLDEYSNSPIESDVVAAANAAFDQLHRWLQSSSSETR